MFDLREGPTPIIQKLRAEVTFGMVSRACARGPLPLYPPEDTRGILSE